MLLRGMSDYGLPTPDTIILYVTLSRSGSIFSTRRIPLEMKKISTLPLTIKIKEIKKDFLNILSGKVLTSPMRDKEATNALSRRDNKTYICPECGLHEAAEDFITAKQKDLI